MSDLIKGKFYNVPFSVVSESLDKKYKDTRLHKNKERIPHKFKHGSSSKENGGFFDESLITSDDHLKIVKLSGSFNYVGLRFDKFKTMVLNQMSSSAISDNSFQQMSASFFNSGRFGNALSDSTYITLIAEDGVGGQLNSSYALSQVSGIVPSSGFLDINISNLSSFNTAATWSFSPGGGVNEINQTSSLPLWGHRFFNKGSQQSAFALSGSESGSQRGVGEIKYVNNVDPEDGTYLRYLIKGKIYGDGEFGADEVSSSAFRDTSSLTFLPTKEIIIYPESTPVRSGSFKYHALTPSLASESGATVTLFYQSGSNGPSGSYTGSGAFSGSHIYLNNTLTTPASSGYYSIPTNLTQVLYAFKGGVSSDLIGTASAAIGYERQVPRFTSSSIIS